MTDILVVDDNPFNLSLIEQQLGVLGYDCHCAAHGKAALALLEQEEYRLVISDCHMAVMDGAGLAVAIRATETRLARKPVPILAWTADDSPALHDACRAAGMNGLLLKPTLLKPLRAVLEGFLPTSAKGTWTDTATARSADEGQDQRVLDLTTLAEFTGLDRAIEADIFAEYRNAHRRDRELLDDLITCHDAPSAALVAHRLKGASRILGAVRLAGALETLEVACRAANWDGIRAELELVQRESTRLFDYIDRRLA